MKIKILAAALALTALPACAQAAELVFHPSGGGKFIYCNNAEGITDTDLMNGKEPAYIMNNQSLEPDTYWLYLSHFNYTGSGKRGYDIELDVEITAREASVLTIQKAFFETPEQYPWYRYDGTFVMSEDSWGCLNVCASMLGRDIINPDGEDYSYKAQKYNPVKLYLEKGETIWLSDYMDNYSPVHFGNGVHIQALIELEKGSADINAAAFESGGEAGDRSGFNPDAKFGTYKRDRCHKGIADTLPKTEADMQYVIDDYVKDGDNLPVTVINQYVPEGAELDYWYTHLNPLDDKWAKYALAESDMLQLKYYDESKKEFYGKNVPEDKRDSVWVFDTGHSDTKQYEAGFGSVSPDDYIPNFEMTPADDYMSCACCLGNYGVETTYNLTVQNKCSSDRYFCYYATTASDILVYDGSGGAVNQKFWGNEQTRERMYVKKLRANSTEKFSICVQLPVNYNGGIKNEFVIEDRAEDPLENAQFRERPELVREYTLLSEYEDRLPQKTLELFAGNLDSFEIIPGNRSYLVRWCAWDGKPGFYYYKWALCNTVYILDSDFNVTEERIFSDMPTAAVYCRGEYYVRDSYGAKYCFAKGGEMKKYNKELPEYIPYYDIENASDWSAEIIENAYDAGIQLERGEDGYNFTDGITRGDFCALAVQLLEAEDAVPKHYIKKKFSDTDDENIIMLCGIGIINGFDDGTFGAERLITREQAAAILDRLSRYLDMDINKGTEPYADNNDISDWAEESVYNMSGAGIMLGTGDNRFSPQETYSREQSVITVWRVMERI